jgi:tocopherol O-methyltransferase
MIESRYEQSPEEVASHYDDLDGFYREIWGNHVHHGLFRTGRESVREATDALVRHAFSDVDLSPGMKVCDVGCGYGETARLLARDHGVRVVGYTVSPAQYEVALSAAPGSDNPRFVLGDWLANDVASDTFDVVFSIESSEHMPDLRCFFAEAARTLKPGGRFMVCTWLSGQTPSAWERRHLLEPICSEGRMRMGTEAEYRSFIEGAGLSIDRFEDASGEVGRTWTLCIGGAVKGLLTRRDYWTFLLRAPSRNKEFAVTLLRIRLAYALGAMRYGIFTATKRPPPLDERDPAKAAT